ncbi:MAG: MaoC family dehydratase [Hyalangium sp.]|uniref:MaoC family dehydratase n=1 Tax=Hyalangium sp. TaxID=2028555 RepID=UPI00389ADF00
MIQLTLEELVAVGERELGTSEWHTVDQKMINAFAEATGDRQWIHVDPKRAADSPFGTTVAHGYLSLSLFPMLLSEILQLTDARAGINYGIDRLRFTAPIPAGSQVRLKARLIFSRRHGKDVLYKLGGELQVQGSDKPALVGEVLYVAS